MSQQYDSKETALQMGMLMAGRVDLYKKGDTFLKLDEILENPQIKVIPDETINQFGYTHEKCTMIEFDNERAEPIRIASTEFRDGFDLWIIEPASGCAIRV